MLAKLSATKFKIIMRPEKDKEEVSSRQVKPEWIEDFLKQKFFEPCSTHDVHKNERSRYCVHCDLSICQYCVSNGAHKYHRTIKVYRHVYQDVVLLSFLQTYMDCSQIQPYKCNKKLVISLEPLPHSGLQYNYNPKLVCKNCHRRLYEPNLYSYCSIACKVKAFKRKTSDLEPPFLALKKGSSSMAAPAASASVSTSTSTSAPTRADGKGSLRPLERVWKRKGTPRRAPLF